MEGLEATGCVEGDTKMSSKRCGQGRRTLVWINLLQCKRAVIQKTNERAS